MYNNRDQESSNNSHQQNQSLSFEMKSGQYPLVNGKFYLGDSKILLRERKQASGNKPKYFLSALMNGKHEYISSLFPIGENRYSLDYKGDYFELIMGDDSIILENKQTKLFS